MAVDDESVSQFMAFTSCQDVDTATHYLEMSGGNVETAVGLFMEHGASGSNDDFARSSSFNNDMNTTTSSQVAEEVDSSSNNYNPYNPDDVRAPDPTRRERLVESWGGAHDSLSGSLLSQAIHNSSLSSRSHAFAFADPDDSANGAGRASSVRDLINQAAASNNDDNTDSSDLPYANKNGPKRLADIFAPPIHLLHQAGGFQGARNRAKDERKWLLVNIQNDSDFACHTLNRDVWRNDLVEALITSSFTFWQAMNDTGDGATYIQRYSVNAFPHVAIIDPRTGRLMWKREGWTQVDPMTSEQFAQTAADFCSQHSFDKPPKVGNLGHRPNRPTKRSVEDLTEQEQLEKAIRESQGLDVDIDKEYDYDDNEYQNMNEEDDDDDDEVEVVPPPAAKLKSDSSSAASPSKPSPREKTFEEEILEIDVGEEPKTNGAILQIRMPGGGKKIRKFKRSDTVKVIYAFVAQSNDEPKKGKSLELISGFPPKDLMHKVNETIDSCNLSGQSISARWK